MTHFRPKHVVLPLLVALLLPLAALGIVPTPTYAASCLTAGTTGLTALVVASPNQFITGTFNAAGCDIGIYIGPGVTGVVVSHATVTGANDHGIFAQDTSNLVVKDSLVTLNGVNRNPNIAEDKAVQLSGTSYSVISKNTVSYNQADGGIGVSDDGVAIDPAAPNPGSNSMGVGNVITGNLIEWNTGGCGIVIAAYDPGVGVSNNVATQNTILGNSPEHPGPAIGQIVVAADGPFTSVSHTVVSNNIVDGSLIPGIVVHSNVFGDSISDTFLVHNKVSDNGFYPPSFSTPNTPNSIAAGFSIVAEVGAGNTPSPTITNTHIVSNTVTNDGIGVWLCGTTNTNIVNLQGNAPVSTTTCAIGGN